MGIYPKEITDGAQSTGNSNVLLLDPKYKQDLQKLYTNNLIEMDGGEQAQQAPEATSAAKFDVRFKFNQSTTTD